MRKSMKSFGALFLAAALAVSGFSGTGPIYAASEGNSSAEDDPVETTVNGQVYFVQSGTKTIVTLDGIEKNPISCSEKYQPKTDGFSTENVPQNGLFTVRYGEHHEREIVNFTNPANNANWKADEENVYQIINHAEPSGWESVRMEPQGDGTIAFKSEAVEKYLTTSDGVLKLISIGAGEEVSSNEKFILYTDTKPKTAKNITVTETSGDTVSLQWTGVSQCLYSGYEVLYSTSENGTYTSAGQTAKTSFEVDGLGVNTKYYFKVRTITNNVGGPYADSKIVYTTTNNDLKPVTVSNIQVEKADGGLKVSWNKGKNAKSYKILRSKGKYGDFQTIGTTTETSYTTTVDGNSKYNNYFKVVSVNNGSESKDSEAVSLESTMFGKNTYIFNDEDHAEDINKIVGDIFSKQHYNQFGKDRYAYLFKQGDYTDTQVLNMGYYTQLLGLGKSPKDVELNNVHTPAALSGDNVTCNFWVGIENATIKDVDKNEDFYFWFKWAASQAAPARRMNIERRAFFQWGWEGYASGGYFADSRFQQLAGSYTQQQYYYRNCDFKAGAHGVNWNNVIQGSTGIVSGENYNVEDNGANLSEVTDLKSGQGYSNWAKRGRTTVINETKKTREKPFLYFDEDADEYKVFVPGIKYNSKGISWESGLGTGTSVSVEKYFYIAKPEKDNAATINKQIKAGKNILFTPGIYYVEKPIEINKANTILLGIGMATIQPTNSDSAIKIADVGGVEVAGLILDAGNKSQTLLQAGEEGCNKDHSDNPTVLHDVIYRVGGAGHLGRVESCQVINSNDVIIDHTWIWRADHGDNTGWYANTSKNGLVVNGDRVTAYGLFCEHFQEYDILWRGEEGSTYFFQNEKCYDPQNQAEWMSHDGTKKGYAAYKVANNVKKHYAVGMGIYDVFIYTNGASIYLDNGIEVPDTEGVLIENLCTVEISGDGAPGVGMNHMTNDAAPGIRQGKGTGGGFAVQSMLSYTNGVAIYLPDAYTDPHGTTIQQSNGTTPTNDSKAEKNIKKEEISKDDEKPVWEMTDADFDKKLEEGEKESSQSEPQGEPINEPQGNPKTELKKNDKTVSALKKGQKITDGIFTYKISSVKGKKGNVVLTGVVKKYRKNLKKATVKATVKYQGYQFKVKTVGKKSFKKCKNLKKVTIGKNVTNVQAKAFKDSKKLKKLIVKGKKLKKFAKNALNKKVKKTVKIKAVKKVKKKLFKILKRK